MPDTTTAHTLFEEGFAKILEGLGHLGYRVADDENFRDTAGRAANGGSRKLHHQL